MALLITGGAGFIGSNLAIKLLELNYEVIVIDTKENPVNLETIRDSIEYIKCDVRDSEKLQEIIDSLKIRGIIHLAAVSRVIWGEQDPERCIDININGTKSVLQAIVRSKSRPWLIFGSSREVYGEPEKLPVKEDFPKIPINVYGYTKLLGERLVEQYAKKYKLNAITLRFSNVYGNEKDILDRVIPRFILAALRDETIEIHGGQQIFDFTHIDDTVVGIVKAIKFLEELDQNSGFYEHFHILPGRPSTLQKIVNIIADYLKKSLKVVYTAPRAYDVVRFYGDPSKAYEILGFKARIFVEEGIPMTIERFKRVFGL